MIEKIQDNIKTNKLNKKLISLIKYVIKNNGIIEETKGNKITVKCENVSIVITISKEEISYVGTIGKTEVTGTEKKINNGYYVRFISKRNTEIDLDDCKMLDSLDEEEFIIYDEDGNEQYLKETFITDNYIEENGNIKRKEPRLLENISMKHYIWITEDNCAIKRRIVKYKYPDEVKKKEGIEDVDKCYFITPPINIEKLLENNNEEMDKDMFFKYFQKEITTKEIMERIRKKNL